MSDYIKYEVRVYPRRGYKNWYLNGKLHREDGPAFEDVDGRKAWYLNGERHREDGPAVEYPCGATSWYLNGVMYCKSDYHAEMARRNNTCDGKTVTIDGKEYTLHEVKK